MVISPQARTNWWRDRAALLDPAAYEWYGWSSRGQFAITVPAGETWYLVQGWRLRGAASADGTVVNWYHRSGGIARPLLLPSGTTLASNGGASFAYVCRPAKVMSLSTYSDPEGLWYSRMDRLRSLPLAELSTHVSAGTAQRTDTAAFPVGVAGAMIVHESMDDGSWLGAFGNDAAALNVNAEISDSHSNRYGLADIYPVRSEMLDIGVSLNNATASGTGTSFLEAHGHIFYVALPSDW